MKIKNKIFNIFSSQIFLTFLGFIGLVYYIWFRFIRERVPRELPFELTLISTLILFYICLIYVYVFLKTLRPKTPSQVVFYFMNILYKLWLPFILLDEYFRKKYFKVVFDFLIKKTLVYIRNILTKIKIININTYINRIIILLIYIPKTLFLLIFIIDLYYHKLGLIYSFILIQIIPLCITYYLYILKLYVQDKIKELSEYYLVEITSIDREIISENTNGNQFFTEVALLPYEDVFPPALSIENFLFFQNTNLRFGYEIYKYKCSIYSMYYNDLEVISSIKKFNYWIPILLYNYIWIEIYTSPIYEKSRQKYNLIIYVLYFMIWFYILTISIHTFQFTNYETIFMKNFQNNIEPFLDSLI